MTSKIKVDNINKVSDDSNIIKKCGTTITLGASGDSIALASGASQTGFGRTGTVDWQTGSIKTGTFTAANGEGYFVDTSSGAVTANLPAGSGGAIVAFADYTRTFQTNNLTITPNGSEKIGGVNQSVFASVEGQALTLVYVDGTEGWINVQNAEDTETGVPPFVAATGGTVLTVGNFKTHVFTGPGTFCVSNAGHPTGSTTVDYFVVAGGGSGSPGYAGGGGGGGGFRLSNSVGCLPAPSMSPLANPTGLSISVQAYPITVGGGGTVPSQGSSSIFSSITSAGGGRSLGAPQGGPGGSGGGGQQGGSCATGGTGNTPPVSPPQGNPGGNTAAGPNAETGGGGGGATGPGTNGSSGGPTGAGGSGSYVSDTFFGPTSPSYGEDYSPVVADTRAFSGGGGAGGAGGVPIPSYGSGGRGGGGPSPSASPCGSGVTNQGGGGGGGGDSNQNGGNGGSGFVAIRYKFQ